MALFRERPLDRLANPPDAVGRELEAAPPVESVDGAQQAGVPFLDQVGECSARPSKVRATETTNRRFASTNRRRARSPSSTMRSSRPRSAAASHFTERVVHGPPTFDDFRQRRFLITVEQFRLARLPEKLIQRVVAASAPPPVNAGAFTGCSVPMRQRIARGGYYTCFGCQLFDELVDGARNLRLELGLLCRGQLRAGVDLLVGGCHEGVDDVGRVLAVIGSDLRDGLATLHLGHELLRRNTDGLGRELHGVLTETPAQLGPDALAGGGRGVRRVDELRHCGRNLALELGLLTGGEAARVDLLVGRGDQGVDHVGRVLAVADAT